MKIILFILTFFMSSLFGQNIYLKNIEYPSNVYTNQIFKIKVKATIVVDDYDVIETNFFDSKNITLLNKDSKWKIINKNEFHNTFIYKANHEQFILPKLEMLLKDSDDNIKYAETVEPVNIAFNNIAVEDKLFSQIIAKQLTVVGQKTKQYSNNLLLTVLKINAYNSNLEDFKLNEYQQQGIDDFTVEDDLKSIYYYIIIPRDNKALRFKYYNYISKEFETIIVPIELSNDLISTQTDLNPKNSKLLFYQKVLISVLTIIFLALYFIYKRNITLVVIFLLICLFIILSLPNKTITVSKNTKIYILPLKNSTIFDTTNEDIEVEFLKSKNGFTKIILPNQKIGWIKQ